MWLCTGPGQFQSMGSPEQRVRLRQVLDLGRRARLVSAISASRPPSASRASDNACSISSSDRSSFSASSGTVSGGKPSGRA